MALIISQRGTTNYCCLVLYLGTINIIVQDSLEYVLL